MVGPFLAHLTALILATSPDAASLVARLASVSSTPAEREEAARGLEAMGRESLPALVAALDAPDLEARSRVLSTWERVQRASMVKPSLVRLDGQGRALPEVVRSIGEQAGFSIELSDQRSDHLVNAREPNPIPFWEAVERLGLSGERINNPGGTLFPTLMLGGPFGGGPTSTSGPFRVRLKGLHDHRDRSLIDGPWLRIDEANQRIPIARGTKGREARFYVDLGMIIEPRMWLTQEGPARAIEAVDDLGQSLLRREQATIAADHSVFFNGGGVAEAQSQLDLAMPEKPGRSIVRLRGTIPVALHVRRPVLVLEIPLEGVIGKTFPLDDVDFTIRGFRQDEQGTHVDVDIRLHLDRLDVPADPNLRGEVASSRMRCLADHQIDLVDADGRVLNAIGGGGWGRDGTGHMSRTVWKNMNKTRPTRLRYYAMTRAFADVPFEFRNVPLP